jgi:uncharacterized Zn finger protein
MQEKIEFLVKGSTSEPYQVKFYKEDNNLTAICNCQAGKSGQYCKHRFAILSNDAKAVVSENISDVKIVASWLKGSDVEKAMDELVKMEEIEYLAKKKTKEARKNLAKTMYN